VHRAEELHSVAEACRQLGLTRTLFYRWRPISRWPAVKAKCPGNVNQPPARAGER